VTWRIVWSPQAVRDGNYRIRFRLDFPNATLEVLRVLPRDKAYR
jgi:mRNA-degrading endonuclease RelE of RelBE toxin-antitoxin system